MKHPLIEVSEHAIAIRMPKLVLSMIAGNEERVIERCLASAAPHVDAMVISVNGRDRTEEIARGVGAHVVRHPWQDFGRNRTLAAQAARRHARELGFDLANTYLLLLDADMVFRVDDPGFRARLTFPFYRIDQRDAGGLRWENARLLRLDHDWRCVRRTHEYWAPFPDVFAQRFDGIWIDDLNDGGEHGRKYERDVELLSMDLDENPSDARSLFYLGETYHHWAQQADQRGQKSLAVMRFQTAIDYYARRWDAGDWDEERWFAKYKQAHAELRLAELTGHDGYGIETLLAAHEARPGRAEAVAALARYYRLKGKNALSVLFAKTARATPPTRDTLFVDESSWATKPDEDLAISSFYVGDIEGGLAACDRLSSTRGADQDFVLKVAAFYLPPAVPASRRGVFEIPPEEVLEGGRWAPSTPTIVRQGDGFLVGVRLVNYWQERGRWYESRDQDRVIRTRTAVVRLSGDLERQEFLGRQVHVYAYDGLEWRGHPQISGLEDQRWCLHQGEIWFTATTFDGDPPRGPRVVLGRLSSDGLEVEFLTDLHYDKATDCEKNWVPRSRDGRLELIYSYDPFVVLEVVDLMTGRCVERSRTETPMAAGLWRGGAACDRLGPVQCGLVHERVNHYREENGKVVEDRNVYTHRFFWEEDGRIFRSGRPFTFDHQGIEYAAGMHMIGQTPERVIVTYSFEDREARFVVFSKDEFGRLFP